MKKAPLVYALILNWNGRQLTLDCVSSILKSEYSNFRVVVIDNGSTDGSVVVLKRKFGRSITVIENSENLGYARGFNVGLRYAFDECCADYSLIMNNDTIIDAQAISELVNLAETDKMIGFVTGKVYYYERPRVLQTVGRHHDPIWWAGEMVGKGELDEGQYDEITDRAFIDDIYTLVRRRVYEDTGGYDSLFFLEAEEYDWQARSKKLGYKTMYTPFARIWHKDSMTIGKESAIKAYYDARNPMLVILLHRSPRFFKRYFWAHARRRIIRSSLVYLKNGRTSNALAKWRGLVSGIKWGLINKKFTWGHFI